MTGWVFGRRQILAGAGAALAVPAIGRAQAGAIRIGEINSYTAQPAFLQPYRYGWAMAVEQVNAAGGINAAYGAGDKLAAATPLLAGLGVAWDEVAVIGDDWPDLPLLARAGFACAPANAHAEARAAAHHVTTARGGDGAAREFCDLLLMAAGRYASLLQQQMHTLDGR